MFKTILEIVLIGLLASAVLAAPAPMIPSTDVIHAGAVMGVTEDSIMLMDDRDNTLETFAVTPQTKITFQGEVAALDQIQMGDRVSLTALEAGGKQIALTIHAQRPK